MPEEASVHNINLIVKDYIRILKLPKIKAKNSIAIILVGIPASGKSYLARNLVSNLPLALISENDIQSFLVPKISFFQRGQDTIIEFAQKVIKELIKQGYSCIFDANLRSLQEREEFRTIVETAGGKVVTIFLNCPKEVAFERIKKRNSEIVSGTTKGFVMDWDYFWFEINSTEPPKRIEKALTFDSSKPNYQMEKIINYLKSKLA